MIAVLLKNERGEAGSMVWFNSRLWTLKQTFRKLKGCTVPLGWKKLVQSGKITFSYTKQLFSKLELIIIHHESCNWTQTRLSLSSHFVALDGVTLTSSRTLRYLGVVFDHNLSLKSHLKGDSLLGPKLLFSQQCRRCLNLELLQDAHGPIKTWCWCIEEINKTI